jgi:hypothetical protein
MAYRTWGAAVTVQLCEELGTAQAQAEAERARECLQATAGSSARIGGQQLAGDRGRHSSGPDARGKPNCATASSATPRVSLLSTYLHSPIYYNSVILVD